MSRRFDLSDVLSITTGRLVSKRHMDGIYDILNYMTSDNLWTHQLPHACDECKPYLLEQHPELVEADEILERDFGGELGGPTGVAMFMATCRAKWPGRIVVEPLPAGVHQNVSPLTGLPLGQDQGVIVVGIDHKRDDS